MTDASAPLVADLVEAGIDRREARWLVEEFVTERGGDTAALRAAAARRLGGEPLQYVIGHWPFRSLDLELNARVLIPRPETEELVDVALAQLAGGVVPAPMVLDLGCGSGAIGLALLDELRARGVVATLVALDASLDALALARRNARRHTLHAVSFVHSSWFEALDRSLLERFDLVVANPPYVGSEELTLLDPVLGFEPREALVAADARGVVGFADLAMIIEGSLQWLAPGGALVAEHASTQREAVLETARSAGYHQVQDLEDAGGLPRVLVARR